VGRVHHAAGLGDSGGVIITKEIRCCFIVYWRCLSEYVLTSSHPSMMVEGTNQSWTLGGCFPNNFYFYFSGGGSDQNFQMIYCISSRSAKKFPSTAVGSNWCCSVYAGEERHATAENGRAQCLPPRRRNLLGCLVESTPPLVVRWTPGPPSPSFFFFEEVRPLPLRQRHTTMLLRLGTAGSPRRLRRVAWPRRRSCLPPCRACEKRPASFSGPRE
jgi:hypothetical protein